MRRALLLAPCWAWLMLFIAAPAAVVVAIALAEPAEGAPPFRLALSLRSFAVLGEDDFYLLAFLTALRLAATTALIALLLAYPMALAMVRSRRRLLLLGLLMLPFWSGFLLRIAAWIGLLRDRGWINGILLDLGLITEPWPLLYTEGAMLIGMVHSYLPFAVLPLLPALLRLDPALEEAAADLGAKPLVAFFTVIVPATRAAAIAAFLLVFIPAAGEVIVPELMGPAEALPVGRMLWQEFFQNRDWPVAAALALLLLAILLFPLALFQRLEAQQQ